MTLRPLVTILLLAATATACGGSGNASEGPIDVSYTLPSLTRDPLNATVDGLDDSSPSIELLEQGENCIDSPTLLQADLSSGNVADLALLCFNAPRQFIDAGVLQPIDDFIADDPDFELSDYTPAALEPFRHDGKLYGLPNAASAGLLYYNAALFERAGLDPDDPPATWQEFEDYARRLDDPATNVDGVVYSPDAFNFETLLRSNGGTWMDPEETRVAFNGPEGLETLEFLTRLSADGVLRAETDNEVVVDSFSRGNAAMMMYSSARIGQLQANAALDFRVAPIPAPTTSGPLTSLQGMGYVMFTQDEERQGEAWAAMKALASPQSIATFSRATGFLSPNSVASEEPELLGELLASDPARGTATQLIDSGQLTYAWPGSRESEINTIIAEQTYLAIRGEKNAQRALDDAAGQVSELLPQGG